MEKYTPEEQEKIKKWKSLVREYELIKKKRHPKFRKCNQFYAFHKITKQTFHTNYKRYQVNRCGSAFLRKDSEPRSPHVKDILVIRKKIVYWKNKGLRARQIQDKLRPKYGDLTPSTPVIYYHIRKAKNELQGKE